MKMVNRAELKMYGHSVAFVEMQQDKKGYHVITMEYCGEDKFQPLYQLLENDKEAERYFREQVASQLVKHHANSVEMNAKAWGVE